MSFFKKNASLTADDLLQHRAEYLARFKLPKYVKFVYEIPHTAAGKIVKPELRALYQRETAVL